VCVIDRLGKSTGLLGPKAERVEGLCALAVVEEGGVDQGRDVRCRAP
jgi:hypothetical protein